MRVPLAGEELRAFRDEENRKRRLEAEEEEQRRQAAAMEKEQASAWCWSDERGRTGKVKVVLVVLLLIVLVVVLIVVLVVVVCYCSDAVRYCSCRNACCMIRLNVVVRKLPWYSYSYTSSQVDVEQSAEVLLVIFLFFNKKNGPAGVAERLIVLLMGRTLCSRVYWWALC